ncbi:MAG TPA: D-alanyl-D-alanine carboxypeptidase/D-alanyl-D-alanine-endopeptidase [Pyrinomonadaceae bacterium]|jgi:D-alanyl-D-alanine carboxypeptidase/D-alanyl-D-alanine-endopeptidase (penicillin-binding protein 4)
MRHQPTRTRPFVATPLCLLVVALTFTQCVAPTTTETSGATTTAQTGGAQARAPVTQRPNGAQARGADAELARRIDRELDEGATAGARFGVLVVSLRDGRTLYARDAERLFLPASSLKLYTTAAALDLLGPDYRWRTSVYAAAPPDARGTISDDLILYGRGAPDLAARVDRDAPVNHLKQLADALYARGVRRVRGRVVGDESALRGEPLGDGWLWSDVQWYYGAEVSALTIDDNEITVAVLPAARAGEPAQVRLTPETDYVRVTNDAETGARGVRPTLGVTRGLSDNEVRVWGALPVGHAGVRARLAVHRPALWAAQQFKRELQARGIVVDGDATARDARAPSAERFDPARATELAAVTSATLGDIAHATNKHSINLNAELILRTLGRERGAADAPDPARAELRGDDEAGAAVIRRWLRERAGAEIERLALHDGSGLSRLDLVTPAATVRLLVRMSQSQAASVFRASLPLAGRDGTLAGRLRGARTAGHIAAKTGTITYVQALAGYADAADGEPLAFALYCNEETTEARGERTLDAVAALLAQYPDLP